MKKLFLLVVCLVLLLASTSCQNEFDESRTDDIYAQIVLSDNSKINLKLYYDKAPKTVKNFIKLAQKGYYENTIFHRVIEGFVAQGGGNPDTKKKIESTIEALFGLEKHKISIMKMEGLK